MGELFLRYLDTQLDSLDAATAPSASGSGRPDPDAELWKAHQRQKLELMIFSRNRLRHQFARHGEAPASWRSWKES